VFNLTTNKASKVRVLILGGTGDAVELAARLENIPEIEAIASLAGRTRQPAIAGGDVRIGGFGGTQGLADYLREMQIDVLIDATHPFAAQISANAFAATLQVSIPRLMLVRPPWSKVVGDRWIEVENMAIAANVLINQARKVFLTIGRQELAAFSHLSQIWFLMRMIDPPHPDVILPQGVLLYDKGPFRLDNEREILLQHNIDTIVSKNSGGNATYAKIIAARELGIQVVMVQRPSIPPGERVEDVDSAVRWLLMKLLI
jgi:precorrin-6A/cobalt-precorrin-6A reductase